MIEFFVVIFGLIIGSFLNVLVYRLPLSISLINPKRSFCTSCNTQIKWYENIPVLSYLYLKAKCPNCSIKISIVYPLVEIVTSVITLLLYLKYGLDINFYISIFLFYTLIVLSFIDFEYKAVPDYLLLIAIVTSFFIVDFSFQNAMIFAGGFVLLDFFITYYIQNIKAKITKNDDLLDQTALGEGDIPIVAIIGGMLGVKLGLVAIFLASLFAILPAIYNIVKKSDIETPFIPFLVMGLLSCFLFSDFIFNILEGII
ncbi:MAG TPA: prepilin peptidase [Arcobacter sp.]|nr:prepilin peptidase [Arcobacter sp.]